MLTAYCRFWQDGIEALEKSNPAVHDEKTGHWYFDDFRISLKYFFNKNYNLSGIGVLTFGPNGYIWSQSCVECLELDEFGSYYYGIEQSLEEARKSKAKNVIIFIDNPVFVELANRDKPYKLEAYNKVHDHVVSLLKEFEKYQIIYRKDYPKSVINRLIKESKTGSRVPKFNLMGNWENQSGKIYFNLTEATEENYKEAVRGYAQIMYDYLQNYFKQYKEDYGQVALDKLLAKNKNEKNSKKKGKLPPLKKQIENEKKTIHLKKFNKFTKDIICQKCGEKMRLDSCYKNKPEKEIFYRYRCKNCLAGKILDEKGRIKNYLRYPKNKK